MFLRTENRRRSGRGRRSEARGNGTRVRESLYPGPMGRVKDFKWIRTLREFEDCLDGYRLRSRQVLFLRWIARSGNIWASRADYMRINSITSTTLASTELQELRKKRLITTNRLKNKAIRYRIPISDLQPWQPDYEKLLTNKVFLIRKDVHKFKEFPPIIGVRIGAVEAQMRITLSKLHPTLFITLDQHNLLKSALRAKVKNVVTVLFILPFVFRVFRL